MSKKAADLRKANNNVINDAFKRLKMTKDQVIQDGMYGLLEDAVQFALEAHDEHHVSHTTIGDTYGWMLVHNHRIVDVVVVATDENLGKADRQLRKYLFRLPAKGWAGVVMAGLEPASYFSLTYELGILNQVIPMTKANFQQYFTKI